MATTIKTVALAGASGNLGAPILKSLTDAGLTVTVLTRPGSSSTYPSGVKTTEIDYDNTESLTAALKDQDALVCAVGFTAFLSQEKLIDAAIASGVKRVLPSEYGTDPDVASVRQLPAFGHKVQVEQYLKKKIQGTSTTYTLVCCNEFFDWDLDNNFGVDIKAKKMEIFDGGDVPFTATPLEFVARGVAGVLQHPAETANRVVRLHGTSMTQNKLLQIIQRYTGKDGWVTPQVSTVEREKQGYEILSTDPSNMFGWVMPFLQCSIWSKKYGGDFSKNNDNELLGLRELSDAEIDEIVRTRAS